MMIAMMIAVSDDAMLLRDTYIASSPTIELTASDEEQMGLPDRQRYLMS